MKPLIIAVALLTLSARAADDRISGTWQADVTGEARTFSIVFHFQAARSTLGGTVEFPSADREFPISEGTISGDRIAFKGFGIWQGVLQGKEIELTRELDGGKKQHMTAHRVPQQ